MSQDCFSCYFPTMHHPLASLLLPGHSHSIPAGSEVLAPNYTTISGSLIAVHWEMFSVITIRPPSYTNRRRQWCSSPDGAIKSFTQMDSNWLEAYVSSFWNALGFVFCTAVFYQVSLARELANHVMPHTDTMGLETWLLASDMVMEEPLDGFGMPSEHNNNIYIKSEQSLTQDWVVSFESIMGCGLGELKAEMWFGVIIFRFCIHLQSRGWWGK